jgi:murein DD-endopeptidase MepM/ murein hydrolase activator NlpD
MRGGLTPAWTLIIVPPTAKASTKRVGVRLRTLRRVALLTIAIVGSALAISWTWVNRQASTATMMADRIAAQEQTLALLTDSLNVYRTQVLAERAAKSPPAAMIMPAAGRITSWFSHSRLHPILRVFRAHRGIDVAAAAGSRIVAPAAATVAFVGRKFGFGLVVELAHSGGVVTRYAHCRTALVQRGDRVAMGQTIATVGSSGLATGPHLHFEVLVKGTAVDPMNFLRGTRASVAPSPVPPQSATAMRENDEE